MKQTPNYNFPILEAGDKYLKDYHNDAFSAIDTELKAMNDKINTLDNADGSILEISQELENTNAEIIDARVGQTTLGDKIRNIDTQLDTIVHEIENKTDINDNSISTESVWSSSKTQTMIQQIPKGEKGDKGEKGEQGIQGTQGPQGVKGADGLTTQIRVNGYTYTQSNGLITLPDYPTLSGSGSGLTTTQEQQITTAYNHSQSTHAPVNAEQNVQSNWTETNTSSDAYIKNKPTLSTVATSGSYNDLSNKPTIPSVPSNLVTGSSVSYIIWVGTQSQYDAISTKDNNTLYFIKEE